MGGLSLDSLVTIRQWARERHFQWRIFDWNAQQALPCQIKAIDSPGVNTRGRIATAMRAILDAFVSLIGLAWVFWHHGCAWHLSGL